MQSPCPGILAFDTAQVLSGITNVDSTGEAIIDVVGGVPAYVRYPSNGDRTPVNVLQMLPVAGDTGLPPTGYVPSTSSTGSRLAASGGERLHSAAARSRSAACPPGST